MARIVLDSVSVGFPVHVQSARQLLLANLVPGRAGGKIASGKSDHDVTVKALDGVSLALENGDRLRCMLGHNGFGLIVVHLLCALCGRTWASIRIRTSRPRSHRCAAFARRSSRLGRRGIDYELREKETRSAPNIGLGCCACFGLFQRRCIAELDQEISDFTELRRLPGHVLIRPPIPVAIDFAPAGPFAIANLAPEARHLPELTI